MAVPKTLDAKLADIRANPSASKAFIIADAKDADMAHGLAAPGRSPEYHGAEARFRTLAEYRESMRAVVRQGLVDIMLMSASSNELLTIQERLFDASTVTPAARANDTSDIFVVRGGVYIQHPSIPFRTATIEQIMCGKADCAMEERTLGADLGLYSLTFTNDPARDVAMLEQYRAFRLEAERKGFRHFLEVFDPNVDGAVDPAQLGGFINDHIARTLAGVPSTGRPIFLKIAYHGPAHMEDLVRYAPDLVPGVLGGAAGTTFDAFQLLWEAKRYGARAALFGRKINSAEHQLAFIEFLRLIADDQLGPAEAVRAYHSVLQKMNIKPHRPLEEDMKPTVTASSYGGQKTSVTKPAAGGSPASTSSGEAASQADTQDDFRELTDAELAAMTPPQKSEYHIRRRDRVFRTTS